jgi:hypothetical protein
MVSSASVHHGPSPVLAATSMLTFWRDVESCGANATEYRIVLLSRVVSTDDKQCSSYRALLSSARGIDVLARRR